MGKKPDVVVCAAFSPGLEIVSFLLKRNYPIRFIATCHADASVFEKEIAGLCRKKGIKLFRKVNINDPKFIAVLRKKSVDLGILAWWPDIMRKGAIDAVKIGWVNLHPSLLPYGRGKHAYYWSIIENTPFGVTLHFIDKGVDTGDILFQKRIPISIEDSGESLYEKGVREVIELFKKNSKMIFNLDLRPKKQDEKKATYRHSREIEGHSEIVLDKSYKASELIDILRGRTFYKGPSAFFYKDGRKYFIRVSIKKA